MGGLDAVQRKLEALETEKREIVARVESGSVEIPSVDAIAARVRHHVEHFQAVFAESPDPGRSALRSLLDGDRMRVYADAAQDFRVEGMIYLPITNEPPGAGASGRFDCVVAGVGFEPTTSGL